MSKARTSLVAKINLYILHKSVMWDDYFQFILKYIWDSRDLSKNWLKFTYNQTTISKFNQVNLDQIRETYYRIKLLASRSGVGNSFGSAGHIRDKKGTEGQYIYF